MNVIAATDIYKYYNDVKALNGVDITIRRGQITGVFGPNGAGKTTLIKVILGLMKPDKGEIEVNVNEFAYIPENLSLYKYEKVKSIINYMISIKGISKKQGWNQINTWAEKIGIKVLLNRKVKELSKGQAKKVMFLIMLIGNPDFFILDEPFTGLDVESAEHLRQIVIDKREENKTILFSTHILEHAEEICDSAVFIKNGEVLEEGDIRFLKKKYTTGNWQVSFFEKFNHEVFSKSLQKKVKKISDTELQIEKGLNKLEILEILKERNKISKIEREEPSLKKIYLTIMGENNERNI